MSSRDKKSWDASPDMPAGHFVSGDVYTDPDIYKDESEKVFAKAWRFACHDSELPEAFDYRVFEQDGQSLFAIRGEDGVIRSFLNVCSHRGAKLLDQPAGNAKLITCFYHRWTYDAHGHCAGIPRVSGYSGDVVSKETMGLREVRTETLHGLVFVTLDDAAPDLTSFVGKALDRFSEMLTGQPLEVFHYNRAVLDCNWKAWHETNMDLYHEFMHVVLRKTQVNAMPMKDRKLIVFKNGHGGSGGDMKAAYDGYKGFAGRGNDIPPLSGMAPTDFRFINLFPSTAIISRGTVVRIDTATPMGPDKTLLEMRGLGVMGEPEEHRRVRQRHHNQYWGPFGRNVPEDTIAAEACADSFRGHAGRYQIISRDEGLTGQDDAVLRAFYKEWALKTGRDPGQPVSS
ncbi:MAG: Rieske 2Fe-2S domain-containing protein [Rhodospirillaceae bacterium]|jgi:methanesulfonate monooxygenase large subunit|nr:Rieske 2Fe-2S domain-containing protein [Rhodospirillaceae bacterium]